MPRTRGRGRKAGKSRGVRKSRRLFSRSQSKKRRGGEVRCYSSATGRIYYPTFYCNLGDINVDK